MSAIRIAVAKRKICLHTTSMRLQFITETAATVHPLILTIRQLQLKAQDYLLSILRTIMPFK